MDERRNEDRFSVSLDAIWDGSSSRPARITDLSESGCFVDAIGDSYHGERLTLKIQLPDGAWLELTAEVVHQMQPVGFGLRFVNLSDQQHEQLQAFIAYLKGPHDPATAVAG
ncbi:MAG TPA: PilZ domain-containing protein [Pyrinomonadaceae bacterium]|nr:PilZ domain-containing protein [Pyrinomonadaceae bacterium]